MIRVGIIGAGFMGRNHFNQYEKLPECCRVVALCDKEADRRVGDWSKVGGNVGDKQGTVRELKGVKPVLDWHDLLADSGIDAIDICAPTFVHHEIVTAALKAGKHVLCEKPMALSVEQCDEMIAVANKADRRLMIAQVVRFWPEYRWLKKVYDERRYGELKVLHLRRQAAWPDYTLGHWCHNPNLSGGAILDLHVHDTDFAVYLLGKPRAVYAQGYRQPTGAVDRVHASWDYGPDKVVQVEGFWDMPKGFDFNMGFTAVFEKAAVLWDMVSGKPLTVFRPEAAPEQPEMPTGDAYLGEIEYFIGCIARGENPTLTTPAQSRDAVALALAEKESVLTGKAVSIK